MFIPGIEADIWIGDTALQQQTESDTGGNGGGWHGCAGSSFLEFGISGFVSGFVPAIALMPHYGRHTATLLGRLTGSLALILFMFLLLSCG